MSLSIFRHGIVFCLLYLTSPSFSKPQVTTSPQLGDTIRWQVPDWKPMYFVDGPLKGQGAMEMWQQYLIRKLPQYRHRIEVMNFARFEKVTQQGQFYCHAAFLYSEERARQLELSEEIAFALPMRLFYLSHKAQQIGLGSKVSFAQLIQKQQLRSVFTISRKYPGLQSFWDLGVQQKNVTATTNQSEQMLHMLRLGRVDYFVDYPHIIEYYRQRMPQGIEIQSVAIRELPERIPAHVGCTKGPWGKKVIASINALIAAEAGSSEWQKVMRHQNRFLDRASAAESDRINLRSLP